MIKSAKKDRVRVEIDIIDAGFYSITVSQLRDKLNEVIKEHGCDCTLGIRKWEDDDSGTLYAEYIREQTDKEFQKMINSYKRLIKSHKEEIKDIEKLLND